MVRERSWLVPLMLASMGAIVVSALLLMWSVPRWIYGLGLVWFLPSLAAGVTLGWLTRHEEEKILLFILVVIPALTYLLAMVLTPDPVHPRPPLLTMLAWAFFGIPSLLGGMTGLLLIRSLRQRKSVGR
jgi:hypothetical protein